MQVFVNISMVVDVMEPVENVAADIRQPKFAIGTNIADQILQCGFTLLNNEIKSISIFKCLMDKNNLWMPKLLEILKLTEPIPSYCLVRLIPWQKHFGDQFVPKFVETIENITERSLADFLTDEVVNTVASYHLTITWRHKFTRNYPLDSLAMYHFTHRLWVIGLPPLSLSGLSSLRRPRDYNSNNSKSRATHRFNMSKNP